MGMFQLPHLSSSRVASTWGSAMLPRLHQKVQLLGPTASNSKILALGLLGLGCLAQPGKTLTCNAGLLCSRLWSADARRSVSANGRDTDAGATAVPCCEWLGTHNSASLFDNCSEHPSLIAKDDVGIPLSIFQCSTQAEMLLIAQNHD